MVQRSFPACVDTVVVGNGPSALILSFILHGNIPYYVPSNPHPDPILHTKLTQTPCLLDIDVEDLTSHFAASRLSYSTQALPINVLLDTLIRPLNDTDTGKYRSCVEWRSEKEKAISHVVLGNARRAGGQWADNPVSASWDIGSLSYAEMLSLPGYAFAQHHSKLHGRDMPDFHRPTRREVAGYFASYPAVVGIEDSIYLNVEVGGVCRTPGGFYIGSHNLTCCNLALGSGVFSSLIPPRPLLQPLDALSRETSTGNAPVLVIGSGFTAADVIISTPPDGKILHIFKWDPEGHPSPLRACHPQAYPEYASVYRRMKLSAKKALGVRGIASPTRNKRSDSCICDGDRENVYEGLPNTYIKDISNQGSSAILALQMHDGTYMKREISSMEYVIGRRGSLSYLSQEIAREIDSSMTHTPLSEAPISGQTLRSHVERSTELAPNVYVIGSLTGDSLIRFAYGGCVFAAREIMKSRQSNTGTTEGSSRDISGTSSTTPSSSPKSQSNSEDGSAQSELRSELGLPKWMRSSPVKVCFSTDETWRNSG